jgi:hypothetical protein
MPLYSCVTKALKILTICILGLDLSSGVCACPEINDGEERESSVHLLFASIQQIPESLAILETHTSPKKRCL